MRASGFHDGVLDAAPIDVEDALESIGLVPVGGTGTAGGWLARRPQDEAPAFELLVVAAQHDERLADRVGRFVGVRHEHLATVRGLTPVGPGRAGVLVDHVQGVSLAAIRRARAPLTDGECATVLIPLAAALSALGDAGLAHGAVDAEHVVVQPDGRPVLVGPRPGVLGTAATEDDLPRLLSTVVGVMPEEDGALLAGPGAVPRLRPVLAALLRSGGSADAVVDACYETVTPEALRLPEAAAMAGAALLPAVGRPFPVATGRTPRGLARPRAAAARGRRRTERRATRARRWTAVLVASVVLGGAVFGALHAWPRQHAAPPAPARGRAVLDRADPAGAAAELTRLRAEVLEGGTPDGLTAVAVPGGPSATADATLIAGLAGQRMDGLTAVVQGVELVGAPTAELADVSVTSAMSAHVTVDGGGARSTLAATAPRTVVLHLRWTVDGWRVWSVTDPAAAP